jgi:hypothetical protein
MSVPQFIFLDTTVFAGQTYNFESVALKTFVSAVQTKGGITLLLPDPAEREVHRHIRERSAQALSALDQARRAAPFLAKWEHYPKKAFPTTADWQVNQLAIAEWGTFLKQFKVQRLGYEGINPATVMAWYDGAEPPFGSGRKKSEFPDAFSVAILDKFAADNACVVAVVSQDQDMKLACERRTLFIHFTTLPQFTEMLVAGEDKVAELRKAVLQDLTLLDSALHDEVSNSISYYHSSSDYEIWASDLENVIVDDIRIVALGPGEATLAFEATVEATQHLKWQEQEYDDEWVSHRTKVIDSGTIRGAAKVQLDARTRSISAVTFIELEEAELEVNEMPRFR